MKVARHICLVLADHCMRLEMAGSLRRGKDKVGDIEIVYVPDFEPQPLGLFETEMVNKTDAILDRLITEGIIEKRANVKGSSTWGDQNKLARHTASGIPIDFFSTREQCWFNYLVCRTGGARSNMAIASAAHSKGWKWHPYHPGFTDQHGNWHSVHSEREVFELVGLPYLEPHERP